MTALEVALCGCGHAERMHELDLTGPRGACRHGSCGCAEYRSGATVEAVVVNMSLPGSPSEPSFRCPECPREFATPQGVGGHRAKAHPKDRAPRPGADADSSSPEPDQPHVDGAAAAIPSAAADSATDVEDDDEDEDEDGQSCNNCGDHVIALSPRGWCDGCEEEAEVAANAALDFTPPPTGYSASARVSFGAAAWIELRLERGTSDELDAFARIVAAFTNAATPFSAENVRIP